MMTDKLNFRNIFELFTAFVLVNTIYFDLQVKASAK